MIICLAGTKGGSGRSTTATNFACIAAGQGMKVLMVDADDQETSADFTAARKQDHPDAPSYTCIKLTGRAVRTEVLDLAPKYDHVIIDTGGRDTTSQRAALSVSDVLLIPFAPRSFDIWTVDKVATLIEEMRAVNPTLKALAFLNRTDPAGPGHGKRGGCRAFKGCAGAYFYRCAHPLPQGICPCCQSGLGCDGADRAV